MWFTPRSALLREKARAFAALTPTRRAGESPGPRVTAMASISLQSAWACWRASSSTGIIVKTCCLDASSGTTPPYLRCSAICEAIMLVRMCLPSLTIATEVSSHDVSIASIFMVLLEPALFYWSRWIAGCIKTMLEPRGQGFTQARYALLKLWRVDWLAPHDICVLAIVAVIPLPHARNFQPIFAVKGLSGYVRYPYFQRHTRSFHLGGD